MSMDGLIFGGLVLLVVAAILGALMWRPRSGRRRTAEEALEADALRREQDATITEATYRGDLYNVPGRRR
jgi:hypothetical protein